MQIALIEKNVIVNVIEVDDGDPHGMIEILTPDYQAVEDITAVTPLPSMGWSWGPKGYTAPAQPVLPTPSAAEVARESAKKNVKDLFTAIPQDIVQAQADAQTISEISLNQNLNSAQIKALINHANGWVSILQALEALVVSLGLD